MDNPDDVKKKESWNIELMHEDKVTENPLFSAEGKFC